ncbi:MAG: hypothetical protein AAGA43_00385 [Bacteroidota bacterium]
MNLFFNSFSESKKISSLLFSLFFFLCIGCSEDEGEFDFPLEGDTLSITDITGNWTAIFAEFQIRDQPATSTNIIMDGGSVIINIQNDGRFTSTITFPGEAPTQFSGQLGFSGSQLVLLDDVDEPGDEAFLGIALSSDDVLEISGILEFDFDGNGTFEETVVFLQMVR